MDGQRTVRKSYSIPTNLNLLIIAGQLAAMFAIFYGVSVATAAWQLVVLALLFAIVG